MAAITLRLVLGSTLQTAERLIESDLFPAGRVLPSLEDPLHPFLFVPGYWILRVLGLDHTRLLVRPFLSSSSQSFLQTYALALSRSSRQNCPGGIATVTDVATYSLANVLLTPSYSSAAIAACSLTSLFNAYAGIRTFSNSLETALTASALGIGLGTLLRSRTHGLISPSRSSLSLSHHHQTSINPLLVLTRLYSPQEVEWRNPNGYHGSSCGDRELTFPIISRSGDLRSSMSLIDSSFYGLTTFTPLNFVRQKCSTVSLRMMMLLDSQNMHESLSHKEFRFIQPLMPLFSCFAARAMVNNYIKDRLARPATSSADVNRLERIISARPLGFILRSLITLVAAFYLLNFHYRAQVSVIDYLRQVPDHELVSVGFLMPCHSTPLAEPSSQITPSAEWISGTTLDAHLNSSLVGLVDQPDGKIETAQPQNVTKLYEDEAAEFCKDPAGFLTVRFPATIDRTYPATDKSSIDHKGYQWPSHVVLFEALWNTPSVREILSTLGYSIVWNAHNGKWHDDPSRRAGSVIVLRSN
ncbi:hypothetical protein H4Q26_006560 [Puccinia striiformis f. sp. tritici PST-130]|nr:hypothetical protein H4Q26_006560 [Puccinia striiformis f. sp. tritici PST-130]